MQFTFIVGYGVYLTAVGTHVSVILRGPVFCIWAEILTQAQRNDACGDWKYKRCWSGRIFVDMMIMLQQFYALHVITTLTTAWVVAVLGKDISTPFMLVATCLLVLFILGTRGVCESTLSVELCDEERSGAEVWLHVLSGRIDSLPKQGLWKYKASQVITCTL